MCVCVRDRDRDRERRVRGALYVCEREQSILSDEIKNIQEQTTPRDGLACRGQQTTVGGWRWCDLAERCDAIDLQSTEAKRWGDG